MFSHFKNLPQRNSRIDVTFLVPIRRSLDLWTGVVDFSIKVCLLKVAADDRREAEMEQFVDRWFRTMTHWPNHRNNDDQKLIMRLGDFADFYSVANCCWYVLHLPDTA